MSGSPAVVSCGAPFPALRRPLTEVVASPLPLVGSSASNDGMKK